MSKRGRKEKPVPVILIEDDPLVIEPLRQELSLLAESLGIAFPLLIFKTLEDINDCFTKVTQLVAHTLHILILRDKISGQEVAASLVLRRSDSLKKALVIDNSPNGLGMVSVKEMVETQQRAYLVGKAVREAIAGIRTQS